ncbi:winged helix-turn-helix domain-containing protein [Geovibrio ferrireducens]|jgi:molybdate transport system regulatory protein|uniref:winged helix-turn-helix domain-containing protein n=1 Tax=Geovibrio ferrireducens TaxID=46201 RepID=UPI002245D6B6|nr:LysR family transcriptional regulator [Geovibrio ferrireducens]
MNKTNDLFSKSAGEYTYGGRVWIDKGGKNFLGLGKIHFLELIKQHGSMSKAASILNMSYSKAWGIVDSMNTLAKKPLVVKKTGGAGGGGAELTEEGERVLELYWEFSRNFELFLLEQREVIEQL